MNQDTTSNPVPYLLSDKMMPPQAHASPLPNQIVLYSDHSVHTEQKSDSLEPERSKLQCASGMPCRETFAAGCLSTYTYIFCCCCCCYKPVISRLSCWKLWFQKASYINNKRTLISSSENLDREAGQPCCAFWLRNGLHGRQLTNQHLLFHLRAATVLPSQKDIWFSGLYHSKLHQNEIPAK